MALLCRKSIYPYEFVYDISKLDHVGLPPKEAVYSTLEKEHQMNNINML